MSSRFVSAGTAEDGSKTMDDWERAKQELDATRQRKEEEGRQRGDKSLYDVLQQNKAAKQEAFEESIRLTNQFRSLDEDEVEFLDSVLESTRAKEAAVQKETQEQLDIFRKQQEKADRDLLRIDDAERVEAARVLEAPEEQWRMNGKKRARKIEKEPLKGVKIRKISSAAETANFAPKVDLSPQNVSPEKGSPSVQIDKPEEGEQTTLVIYSKQDSTSTDGDIGTDNSRSTSQRPQAGGLLSLDYSSDDD